MIENEKLQYYRMINYALKELENYKSLMYSIFLYLLQALLRKM